MLSLKVFSGSWFRSIEPSLYLGHISSFAIFGGRYCAQQKGRWRFTLRGICSTWEMSSKSIMRVSRQNSGESGGHEFFARVPQKCGTALCYKNVSQNCPQVVSCRKNAPKACLKRVLDKNCWQKCRRACFTRVSRKSIFQEFFTRMSYNRLPQKRRTRPHVFSSDISMQVVWAS